MSITIRYFASLKEQLGKTEDQIDDKGVCKVSDVWKNSTGLDVIPDHILCAVNMEYANPDTEVNAGDEVAFFPPVTGG